MLTFLTCYQVVIAHCRLDVDVCHWWGIVLSVQKEHCISAELSTLQARRFVGIQHTSMNTPVNKTGQLYHMFFWFFIAFFGGKLSTSVTSHDTKVCEVTVCHLQCIHERLFFYSENCVCKAFVFLGTKNSVCILVFLKTFRKTYWLNKSRVSHPAFLIEKKKNHDGC